MADRLDEVIARQQQIATAVEEMRPRLERIEGGVNKTNGRVTKIETWQAAHIEEHKDLASVAEMAQAIQQIRRFVVFVLPILTLIGTLWKVFG